MKKSKSVPKQEQKPVDGCKSCQQRREAMLKAYEKGLDVLKRAIASGEAKLRGKGDGY